MAPTTQHHKAHSDGTKVTPGKNAPVTREGAGFVAPESLAAQSYNEGGGFADNRRAQPDSICSSSGAKLDQSSKTSSSNGVAAPSYVAVQYLGDRNGPHGKNLKEDGFNDSRLEDGIDKAFNSEPGSINDPSRLAESQFQHTQAAQPSVRGRNDGGLSTATAYDGLSREVSS